MISVRVYADEAILRLDQFPKNLREALKTKFEGIFEEVRKKTFSGVPGKFVDQEFVNVGFSEQGQTFIGFMESRDKPDTYNITPKSAAFLQFRAKDGAWVRTTLVRHPFLKAAPIVERSLATLKPWIESQLDDMDLSDV